ncbi:hypothetical protein BDK51DRAFT_26741 [Blyttiomyces helicus]|uniref:Uncharacterized protein n=1 Tax=Blyttiomyces helicus TaxID=388810 RepID=A0A4P9W7J9_9FUNG|nr:hypothetical protein BDK51DRAFT_26741 [Blyttiomyces helicus]|eukprot:RKO87355.1 hypothetical protein BDK51DRAFT_26741 [Blyttiomyces helicus]
MAVRLMGIMPRPEKGRGFNFLAGAPIVQLQRRSADPGLAGLSPPSIWNESHEVSIHNSVEDEHGGAASGVHAENREGGGGGFKVQARAAERTFHSNSCSDSAAAKLFDPCAAINWPGRRCNKKGSFRVVSFFKEISALVLSDKWTTEGRLRTFHSCGAPTVELQNRSANPGLALNWVGFGFAVLLESKRWFLIQSQLQISPAFIKGVHLVGQDCKFCGRRTSLGLWPRNIAKERCDERADPQAAFAKLHPWGPLWEGGGDEHGTRRWVEIKNGNSDTKRGRFFSCGFL